MPIVPVTDRSAPRPAWRKWPILAWSVWQHAASNDAGIAAAAIALYVLLGLVPALSAIGLVCGWLSGPADVLKAFAALSKMMPPTTGGLVLDQLTQALDAGTRDSIVVLVTTLGFGLYGLVNAAQALIDGLNLAYRQTETRGWVRRTAVAAAMALGGAVAVVVMIAALLVISRFDAILLPLHRVMAGLTLAGTTLFATWLLTMVYRHAPSHQNDRPQRVWPGAICATMLGVASSSAFALYAAHLAHFSATYGVLASVAPVLLWLQLCGYVLLLGASLNAQLMVEPQ